MPPRTRTCTRTDASLTAVAVVDVLATPLAAATDVVAATGAAAVSPPRDSEDDRAEHGERHNHHPDEPSYSPQSGAQPPRARGHDGR